MDLWAFSVSPDGLGLSEERFWTLTPVEHNALTHRYMLAHGIKPEPTVKDQMLRREFDIRMNRARCQASEKRTAAKAERRAKRNRNAG